MNFRKRSLFTLLLAMGSAGAATSQIATPNIDFEAGTTAGWTLYKGTVSSGPVWSLVTCTAVPTLHDIMNSSTPVDYYGGFPAVGAGLHSLKLGKDTIHNNADGASYNFHIPGAGKYRLQYDVAVVLQDPGHSLPDEPRFEITAIDSATGTPIGCGSGKYIAGSMPGFSVSTISSIVYYMPWKKMNITFSTTAATTVTIFFRVADCGTGGHFGYAYVDVDSVCLHRLASPVLQPCHATADTFAGPLGYSSYTWFDSLTFTHVYSSLRTCIVPAPAVPTTYAVIIQPYVGFGCSDTLYTRVIPEIYLNERPDTSVCLGASFSLTSGAVGAYPPLTYTWSPSSGLSCTACDPVTCTPPQGITTYSVTVTDTKGCTVSGVANDTAITTPAISGLPLTFTGHTTGLSDAITGGTWTSGSTTVATIGSSSGIVSGVTAGTASITYTPAGGCPVYITVAVLPSLFAGMAGTHNSGIYLFPNPTTGILNIGWENQQLLNAEVVICDVAGRQLYQSALIISNASGEQQIDLGNLNDGVYIVTIKSEVLNYSGKLSLLH